MKRFQSLVVMCAVSAAMSVSPHTSAAPAGALDPSFGIDGRQTVALATSLATVNTRKPGMAVQTAAGQIYQINNPNGSSGAVVIQSVRLHHDGALDTSFGINGIASAALPEEEDWEGGHFVSATAMQADGRIIVGLSNPGMAACRLLASGALDVSFGAPLTPGCINIDDGTASLEAIAIQPDGKIVLAGHNNLYGKVTRLHPDGMLDQSFGEAGTFSLEALSGSQLHDIAAAQNGDLLVVGHFGSGNVGFLILRLNGATGELVEDFGIAGARIVQFDEGGPNFDGAMALAILSDDSILVAGYARAELDGFRPAMVKLAGNGGLDLTFGFQGKSLYDPCSIYPSGCDAFIRDISALPGGRFVLAGVVQVDDSATADFLSMRILANGMPDPAFGTGGIAGTSIVPFDLGQNSKEDAASTVLLEGERILLAGHASVGTDEPTEDRVDFALARLDHGKTNHFPVTPIPGFHGSLSPATQQLIGHSSRAEFVVLPDPGYMVAGIETGSTDCGGGMDGKVYVSAPIVKACTARISFKPIDQTIFSDGFD